MTDDEKEIEEDFSKLASREALPDRGPELHKWFDENVSRLTEGRYNNLASLSEAITSDGHPDLLRNSLRGAINKKSRSPRPLKLVEAVRLANVLGLPIANLIQIFGFDLVDAEVRPWGYATRRGNIKEERYIPRIAAPPIGRGQAAVEVRGSGPWANAVAFYVESEHHSPKNVGHLVVAKPKGKGPMFGVLSETQSGFLLTPLSGAEPTEFAEIEWSAVVLWMAL